MVALALRRQCHQTGLIRTTSAYRKRGQARIKKEVDAMPRLQPIEPSQLTAEQRPVYEAIASGPRGGVRGPFLALLHVPELANRIQHLGELIRYDTSLGRKLSELAIIVTARGLRCHYEWFAHAKIAAESGLPAAAIEAIRTDKDPGLTDPKERVVHRFARELVTTQRVSDATYEEATRVLGTVGAVELASMVGYYAMIAMTLNAHAIMPPGEPPFTD
jgi:4-carboxymuconolactone decarboxylase